MESEKMGKTAKEIAYELSTWASGGVVEFEGMPRDVMAAWAKEFESVIESHVRRVEQEAYKRAAEVARTTKFSRDHTIYGCEEIAQAILRLMEKPDHA